MTDKTNQKSILQSLGLQQMINQYAQHCARISQPKKNNNLTRGRYISMSKNAPNKTPTLSTNMSYTKTKISSPYYHNINSPTLHQNTNPCSKSISRLSSIKIIQQQQQQKNPSNFFKFCQKTKNNQSSTANPIKKNVSSAININSNNKNVQLLSFSLLQKTKNEELNYKNDMGNQHEIERNIDMANVNKINTQSLSTITSQLKSSACFKQNKKFSSYLMLKTKNNCQSNQNKSKSNKNDILQSPVLTRINKRLKEFQRKSHNPNIHININDNEKESHEKNIEKNQYVTMENNRSICDNKNIEKKSLDKFSSKLNTHIISNINVLPDNNKEDFKEFEKSKQKILSINTTYYGFSFKNQVPIKKNNQSTSNIITSQKKQSQNKKKYSSTLKMNINCAQKKQCFKTLQQKTYKNQANQNNKSLEVEKSSNHKISQSHKALKPPTKPKPFIKSSPHPKLLKDRYQLIKLIGHGLSGQVYQSKDILSNRFIAIKIINSTNTIEYDFFREIEHENIIKYYNSFVEGEKRYLVLEYFPMTLGSLVKGRNNRKDKLTEDKVKQIFRNVVTGLAYLHSLAISHRDIKLENIVISQDLKKVKFIDFGLCIDTGKLQTGLSTQFCGTLSYLPPQIFEGKSYQPKKADIWSLGIVLYGLIIGRLPYKGKNEYELLSKISKNKLVFPQNLNHEVKKLILGMLEKDTSKRLLIDEIITHPWLNE